MVSVRWNSFRTLSLFLVCLLLGTGCRLLDFKSKSKGGEHSPTGNADGDPNAVRSDLLSPLDLRVSVLGSREVLLSWSDTSDLETGFRVERSSDGGNSYSFAVNIHENFTVYRDEGVQPNTTYRYRLSAFNEKGFSAYIFADATTPTDPPPPLSAPVLVNVVSLSTDRIKIVWTDTSAQEKGFRIERRSPDGTVSEAGRATANGTLFTDVSLAAGQVYRYRVCAYDDGGDGPWSGELSATTFLTSINAPTSLVASVFSASSIRLHWRDNSNNEEGFKIERSEDGANFGLLSSPAQNVDVFDDQTVQTGRTYTYRVYSYLGAQQSANSNTISVTIASGLRAPSSLIATAVSSSEIQLTWIENSTSETGVSVERSLDGVSFGAPLALPANTNTLLDGGLNPSTPYYYRVRVYDSEDFSVYSNVASATTAANIGQGGSVEAPTQLVASPQSSSIINLTWTDNSGGSAGFKIERHKNGEIYGLVTTLSAGTTSFSDTGLLAATQYTYRVRAFVALVDSSPSNEYSATTDTAVVLPDTPTGLAASIMSSHEIQLSWVSAGANTSGFKIERATESGAFTLLANVNSSDRVYSDQAVLPTTMYRYRIFGVNVNVFSSASNVATVTTPADATLPAAPSNLVGAVLDDQNIRLNWTDNSDNESGFVVYRSVGSGAFSEVGRVSTDVKTYTNGSISGNTTYHYKVHSYNGGGQSVDASNTITVTTPFNSSDLSAPTDLRAVVITSPARIDLFWVDNASSEIGYVLRTTAPDNTFSDRNLAANSTGYSFTSGLMTGLTYRFVVFASNGSLSSPSNEVSVTVPNGFASVLNAPTGLIATHSSSTQIELAWYDTNTNPNESSIRVEHSTDSGVTFTTLATLGQNSTSYTHAGLGVMSRHDYRVVAIASGQNVSSGPSAPAHDTTAGELLNKITGVQTTTVSSSEILVSWTDTNAAPNNESQVKLEFSSDGTNFYSFPNLAANATSYRHTGLDPVSIIRYRLTALASDPANNSPVSDTVSGMTDEGTLVKPVLTGYPGSGKVYLEWSASVVALGRAGFLIERYDARYGTWDWVTTTDPNTYSYEDATVSGFVTYKYRVTAVGQYPYRNSPPSNEISATPSWSGHPEWDNYPVFTSNVGVLSDPKTFTLKWVGQGQMIISSTQFDSNWTESNAFQVTSNTCTTGKVLDSISTCKLTVACRPPAAGSYFGNFIVNYQSGGNAIYLTVSCTANPPPTPVP